MNQTPKLEVGVKTFIFNKQGKILILKRNLKKYPTVNNHYDIPGGRINPKYDLITNLKREVLEETALKINNPHLITAQDIFEPGFRVVRLTYISSVKLASQLQADKRVTSSKVVLSDEHAEHKWLSLNELIKLKGFDKYTKAFISNKKHISIIKDIIKDIIKNDRQ